MTIDEEINKTEETDGYIVQADDCYLTNELYWYLHDSPTKAFVHKKESIEIFRKQCKNWETQPQLLIPAQYKD